MSTFVQKLKTKFSFLKDKNSLFYYFLFLVGLAIIMCSIVLVTESFTIPLGGDYVQQQIPFYTNGYDDWWHFLTTGEFPLWDANTVLGVNNIGANSFYYFLNPFFLPILICPRSLIPQGLAFLMILKMALAGITFRTYLKYMGVEEKYARIFAIAYAFSGWNLYYLWFNHFMEVVVMFPLVLLGIEKVLKERRPMILMVSLAVLGLANYFFLVVSCFAGVIYAVFRFFQTIKDRNWKSNVIAMGLGILGFAVGLMLCAIVLLPCLNAVTEAGRVENATFLEQLKEAWNAKNFETLRQLLFDFDSTKKIYYPLVTYFFPVMSDFSTVLFRNTGYDNTISSLFVYTPLILMVVPTMIESVRKKKVSHILAIAAFVFMLFTPISYQFFHGFTVDYGRWQLFVVASLITYLAVNYKNFSSYPKWYLDISVLFVLFCMSFTVVKALENQYGVYDYKETFGIVIYQFVYVLVIYSIMRWKIDKAIFHKILAGMLAFEVVIVGNFTLFGQKTRYQYLAGGPTNYQDEERVVKNINKQDNEFFRIFNTTANESTNNLGMREGYNGVGGFHSLYNSNIKDFLNWTRILYSRDTWIMGSHEKLANLDEFLGVKYYIIKNSDYNTSDDEGNLINDLKMQNVPFGFTYRKDLSTALHTVYENENFIQLGYAFDNIITNNTRSVQNYMYDSGNFWSVYSLQNSRNNGSCGYNALLEDFLQVIKNEEALLSGAIMYNLTTENIEEDNNYDDETLETLSEFLNDGKVRDYLNYSGRVYAGTDLSVERYDTSSPSGVGNTAKELLDTSNCYRVTTQEPYRYYYSKYIIKARDGSVCSNATKDNKCFVGLKMNMDRFAYVHLIDENDEMITFDYHQYVNQSYKNLRGFYTDRPIKAIVVKPMINEADNTNKNMNGFAVYEEDYNSYLARISKLKESPLENIKVSKNEATFTTNFSQKKIIVTTIPYDAGWKLKVNNKDQQIFKVQGGFIGFVGNIGLLNYKLSYFTPMLKQGLVISFMGIVLFCGTNTIYYLIDRKKKNKESKEDNQKD